MRFWWVNQNQTFAQEQAGGYLWSPKRAANNRRNHFYDTMREVQPGDLVLSFQGAHIRAIGVARSYCYESPKPPEFGSAGLNWERIGWRVEVRWTRLRNQIRPAAHIAVLRPTLPPRYAPLQADNGRGLQGVYLTEIPTPMMATLAGLIGYEARVLMDAAPAPMPDRVAERPAAVEALKQSWEDHLEDGIKHDGAIPDTDRVALVRSRRGQGIYRESVLRIERACRVTRVDNPEHLIASHCKPWRHASNDERLDGENGLMLTPSIDHLFDRGFISFEDSGRLIVSPVADRPALRRMGIETETAVNVGTFSAGQRRYLDYHRDQIFLATR
ncbi:MAG: HNH endonuclease [Krumholzibacteria bacterium]|nr:HNH endonuclease [Candidatus Krumholzibacteria bacterium]